MHFTAISQQLFRRTWAKKVLLIENICHILLQYLGYPLINLVFFPQMWPQY
jgi:hypothetical protein